MQLRFTQVFYPDFQAERGNFEKAGAGCGCGGMRSMRILCVYFLLKNNRMEPIFPTSRVLPDSSIWIIPAWLHFHRDPPFEAGLAFLRWAA